MNQQITLIVNNKCWIEHIAKSQLETTRKLSGVIRAVGLPDLHAGKIPVGVAIETADVIYPHLIGNDIGCGMGLFETNCALRKYRQDKLVSRLNHIRALEDIETINPYDESCPIYGLGTIGGGNHFVEFQQVEQVLDQDAFDSLKIDKNKLLLLVHSGSRDYGQRIISRFPGYDGLPLHSDVAREYLGLHNDALLWAKRNRAIVAQKLADWLGYTHAVKNIVDCHHNYVEEYSGRYIHRKGAVSALNGPVVIPGSRGSLTYIVKPAEDTSLSAHSLSHGAGRKWARSLCKARIRGKYNRNTIRENPYGGKVVCHDTDLLFQEAPEAYKNIEHVIAALLEAGLCTVIATLRPLITYKG